MAAEKDKSAPRRKTEDGSGAAQGRKPHQRLKAYLVLQILQKKTDEDHPMNADKIAAELAAMGIDAERRGIYEDIKEINRANYLLENEHSTIEEAEEALAADKYDKLKLIVFDSSKGNSSRGFYYQPRRYNQEHIRLLAETVYTARFLSEKDTEALSSFICGFVSEHQARAITHDAFLIDRVKTNNKNITAIIRIIDDAMAKELGGERHKPEQISFKYLKSSINDLSQQVERRQGERYTVSPYKLLINDGNYYMLAYDGCKKQLRTYRVDRMKDVRLTGLPREGAAAFSEIDLKSLTKRRFSMFGGKTELVQMRFVSSLLDAVIEKLGKNGVRYRKLDEHHFSVTANIDISDQFFGWVLGFGKKVQIQSPQSVVDKFKAYIDGIRIQYKTE